ncbi:biotin--[acetyl-CoA-carboxylase] ligase [Carnobacteriaceae bacterium 52-44]|jgi:birA, biotin-[acetyl-CoA-carboxylase] ligase region
MESKQLNQERIQSHFEGEQSLLNIQLPSSVSSTNDEAKVQLLAYPNKINLVATNKQTAGRGRQGRAFYSSLKHGLYFSIALKPNTEDIENIPLYTIMAAATLVEVLEKSIEHSLSVKWVNDVFYQGRKISGILSEMVSNTNQLQKPGVVVGIGINFAGSFSGADDEAQNVAGTLFGEELPEDFDQSVFLGEYLSRFYKYHQNFEEKEFMAVYEKHLIGIGKEATYSVNNERHRGIIQGINNKGHLLVKNSDQTIETLYGQAIHFSSSQFIEADE